MNKEYRNGISSFEKFAQIQNEIRNSNFANIRIHCENTTYISPVVSTLFGSLPHYGNFYNKNVKITYNIKNGKRYIQDVGIDKYYGNTKNVKTNSMAVPFQSIDWKTYEGKDVEKCIDAILKQLPINLEDNDRGMLFSIIGEIFNNAKDHSGIQEKSNIRVYYCAYWNSKRDTYIVSIYDTGVGISKNVSNYLNKQVSDSEAITWALGDGNSTQNTANMEYTRGIGLNSLEKFIKANKGELFLGSGNAICKIDNNQRIIKPIEHKLRGTIYVFTVKIEKTQNFNI